MIGLVRALGKISGAETGDSGTVFLVAGFTALPLTLVTSLSVRWWSPHVFEVLVLITFGVLDTAATVAPYFQPEAAARHIGQGLAMMALKPVPIIFGMRQLPYMGFLAASSTLDGVMQLLTAAKYGEELPMWNYSVLLLAPLLYFALLQTGHTWIRAVYAAQQELLQEKEGVAMLVTATCDAAVWLDADRNTITRSDVRFEDMIGAAVVGTKLSAYVLQTAEEQSRLRGAFKDLPTDRDSLPVVVFPTTLLGVQPQDVDFLIVDRRPKMAAAGDILRGPGSFLVGVRAHGVGPLPPLAEPMPPPPPLGGPARVAGPVPEASTAAPAAAPGQDEDADSLNSDEQAVCVALPELEAVKVTFELEGGLSIRHFGMRFVASAPNLQPPQFVHWLQEPVRFLAWAQGRANAAFSPGGAVADSDSEDTSNYGRVAFELPAVGLGNSMLLAGDAAHLQLVEPDAEDESEGPVLGTLLVTGLAQVQFRCGARRAPPARPPAAAQGAAAPHVTIQL